MRGNATTLTFTALLCLEVLPKPSIRTDPGTMVAQGGPVTIWCQGSLLADVYRLHKERSSAYWEAKAPQGSRNKAWFHFASLSSSHAGQYQCAYHSRNGWSQRSDPLPLVVTGVYRAPSLSAQPSPVVAAGSSVSLTCSSQYAAGTVHLLKEGGTDPLLHKMSRSYGNQGREQAVFPVGPVTTSHGGTYRCYDAPSTQPYLWSRPSDPLHLQVTGLSRAPSLSAQPSWLVLAGNNLTLQCRSEASFRSFALTKDEGLSPPLRLEGQQSPDFPLGRVSRAHGGQYRCYSGHNSYAWSAPSAPLDILITGMHRKPSLSAHPGASVPRGENVTLQCRSEVQSDTFHLSKEGSLAAPQHLHLQNPAPPIQANFTLHAVTSAHSGTYRCYSSHSTAPHLLSIPSDPLELQVSGSSGNQLLPALESASGESGSLRGGGGGSSSIGAPSLPELMASGQPLLTGISLDSKDGDAATLDGTVSELSSPPRSCLGARQRAGRGSQMALLLPTVGSWTSRAPPGVRGPPSTQGASHLLPQHDSPQRRACLGLRKARARPAAPPRHTLHLHAGPVLGVRGQGGRSGWAGTELGLMHPSLNWCSAWK
ncbi:leukocyte immunoglobulin-like receptor subfamily A member 6 isoform X2 [Bubalus bubalis]|uniref:leukocyte immunoglobulin-like receptor subfamily A member 6 isoform X2 n=1 Tax=Bubalus bubalis TaxID=89462 RepID=UPI001E1B6BE0|nr:leukocyte immunoglobulin-like receptor subfamily A member 6 isoform X2 [Bubalus bubalis]